MDAEGIRFEVVVSRNKLYRGAASEDTVERLSRIRKELAAEDIPMQRTWRRALSNALDRIRDGDLELAGHELDFVHNLPLAHDEVDQWDSRHFFEIQLLGYVERFDENSIRDMLKLVGPDVVELEE